MKNFSSKGIRFSGDSIKGGVGFIDLVYSTKNTITMEGLDYIRRTDSISIIIGFRHSNYFSFTHIFWTI